MALIRCPECNKKISNQCSSCPRCGFPVEKDTLGTTHHNKKPFYKRILFWVIVGVVIIGLAIATILLLNRNAKPKYDEQGNPMFVELTNEVYTNANNYKGYNVKIKGKIFQVLGDDGTYKCIQIWLDPDTCEQNLMIYYNTDANIKSGDYISCSGYIDSVSNYTNAYGTKLFVPVIYSSDLIKSTYIDVMSPTIDSFSSSDLKNEKVGYSVSIDKIEFAENETRFYITASNNGKADMYIDAESSVVIQNGKQHNTQYNKGEYEEIPYTLTRGTSSSGIVVFPKIEANEFKYVIDVHSDDYDEEISKFSFDISIKNNTINPNATESSTEENATEKTEGTTAPAKTPNSSTIEKPDRKAQAVSVALSYYDENYIMTPNYIKSILEEQGFSSDEINYVLYGGPINWRNAMRDFIWTLNDEADVITVSRCRRCAKRYRGDFKSCQDEECGGGTNWEYFYGYSRPVTEEKLLAAGYSQTDVINVLAEYEYGYFIDEADLGIEVN